MQLQSSGHPLHTRALTITASVREDRRWHVRGDVVDLRKCSFVPMLDDIQPAGLVHQMAIEFDLDLETRRIEDIEVEQVHVAVEPSALTGGECCRDPGPRLTELSGEILDAGFNKRLGVFYGGALGCSHLLTLFQLMANALPVAISREARARAENGGRRAVGERPFRRAVVVDGSELAEGGLLLCAQLGDFFTRPAGEFRSPMARLSHQHDVRVQVKVESGTRALQAMRVAERTRDSDTLHTAPWHDRMDELAGFEGAPIAPGLARRVLGALGGRDDRAELRDLLLQLAPGYVQVLAAISERFYGATRRAAATDAGESGAKDSGGGVEVLGGMTDSCWMWRSGGPMHVQRSEAEQASGKPQPKGI